MKERILVLAGLLLSALVQAQTPTSPLRLSLQEARAIALKNNPDLQIKQLEVSITKAQADQARLRRVPLIYSDFNMQRNLIIPVTPVPANAFRPDAPEGELIPLRFTTKWTSNTGVNAELNIFNPQKRTELAEARLQTQIRQTEKEAEEIDLSYNLDEAYAAAIIAAEQLKLAAADTLNNYTVWKMSREQFDAGRLMQTDLNKVKADLNNAKNNFEEAQKIWKQAQAELMVTMGYPPSDEAGLELTDDIEILFRSYQQSPAPSAESIALRKLTQEADLLNTQLSSTKAGYLPSIILKAYYGANYFDNRFEIFKGNNWHGNSFINLGVRLPITEGLERSKKLAEIRLQTESNRLSYLSQQNKNELERLQATRDIAILEKKYLRSKENYDLAADTYRIAQQQYENGRLLIGDLSKSNYAYQLEKNNYLNVAYDYIIAKMKLEKGVRN
ncbi:MAG: TolC family protein [Arcticibacter sp.]